MEKLDGVANTLFLPLYGRIYVSKKFPEYFYDEMALKIGEEFTSGISKGSFEYTNIAYAARYYNMDKMITRFIREHKICNIVLLGIGLETAYDRLTQKYGLGKINYYGIDFPEVIEIRKKYFGKRKQETLIAGDMLQMQWKDKIDTSIPTLLVASGLFQYFFEDKIIEFIRNLKKEFPYGELIFDTARKKTGLRFANWYIRRTGNLEALMHFYIENSADFSKKTDTILVEELIFFKDARELLRKKLKFITKLFMKIADYKRQALIIHLKW